MKKVFVLAAAAALATCAAAAQSSPLDLVQKMVTNERNAEGERGLYLYLSKERSDRTGGHLWTERVAETAAGKVRLLLAEDDHPLPADRAAAERARLNDIAAHPEAFQRREQALKNDERHAKQMLELLPKAFLFDPPVTENGFVRMNFHPNPAYDPQSMEEKVLKAMTGQVIIDAATRLHEVEGRLPEDVSLGFGLLATIQAGSSFRTTRDRVAGNEWKTSSLDTDVHGHAIFFKAIGKQEHQEHTEFKVLPPGTTVPQAVALLEH